jgi:hypothetical protein
VPQNLSKLQRASTLKEALDNMQPPPENVRLNVFAAFHLVVIHYIFDCRVKFLFGLMIVATT